MTLTQVLGRFVRFNRCKANSSPSLRSREGLEFAPGENLCEWVCPDTVGDTQRRTSSFKDRLVMGKTAGREDFEWVYNDQPHTSRRKEILGEKTVSYGVSNASAPLPRWLAWLTFGIEVCSFRCCFFLLLPPDLSLFMKR